jgi:hypothetical protein
MINELIYTTKTFHLGSFWLLTNITEICIAASIRLKNLKKNLVSSSMNPPKLSEGGSFLDLSWLKTDE